MCCQSCGLSFCWWLFWPANQTLANVRKENILDAPYPNQPKKISFAFVNESKRFLDIDVKEGRYRVLQSWKTKIYTAKRLTRHLSRAWLATYIWNKMATVQAIQWIHIFNWITQLNKRFTFHLSLIYFI